MRASISSLSLSLALAAALPAAAQTGAAPSREALALGARAAHAAQPRLDDGVRALVDNLANSYRATATGAGEAVDEKALAAVSKSEAEALRPVIWDGMARLYAETYSLDELKGLVAYYAAHPGDAQNLPQPYAAKSDDVQRRQRALVEQIAPRMLLDFFGDYCSRAPCSNDTRRIAGLPVR